MSHTPEWPELYVCEECRAVYAGIHEEGDQEHEYHPPESCSACGNDTFIEIERIRSH